MKTVFAMILGVLGVAVFPTISHAALAGLWRFNTNISVQPDSSGNGNSATANGNASWAFDGVRSSGVMTFDGNNDFLAAPDSASLSILGDITIAAWVNVGNTLGGSSNWRGILNKGTGSLPASYQFFFNQGNLVPVMLRGDGTNIALYGPGSNSPTQNTWEHWAITQSGTNVKMYRNAALVGSGTISVPMADNNGSLYIGNRQDLNLDWLGRMDDVAIFDEALNLDQVATIRDGDFRAFGVTAVPEPAMLLIAPLLMLAAPFVIRRVKGFLGS
jgi:hypothetical protein